MIFLSPAFAAGFIILFLLYWTLGTRWGLQNVLLLLAGLLFYGWLDMRFLALVLFSAGFNMLVGIAMTETENERRQRLWLWVGVAVNISLLGYFKYFGFFYDAFAEALLPAGIGSHLALKIALPLGISYWSFQLIGYLIDVYNGSIDPCRKPLLFFTYVLHFPKMLAGPVERLQHFLPRISVTRSFSAAQASDGIRQFLWGVFAKLVIADNCAAFVDLVFNNIHGSSGSTLLMAACAYLIQVYSDFSGYSNMAIGLSKLLGIPLMVNFRTPFFATDIGGFWRRWHVSLTTWMMDYVFTPLSFLFRAQGKRGIAISIFITFLAVGVWHGANWTFILFGILQGIYFLPLVLRGSVQRSSPLGTGPLATFKQLSAMGGMFLLMSLSFVLLRASSVQEASNFWNGILSPSLLSLPANVPRDWAFLFPLYFGVEWFNRNREHALSAPEIQRPLIVRWSWLALVIFLTGMYMASNEAAFIYFSF